MSAPRPFEQLLQAAQGGNLAAQYNLGVCYLRGDGVERDFVRARRWLEAAADAGLAAAQSALGYLYLRAQGVPYDPGRAIALFQRAAEQEFPEAMYRYAEAQATGLGCRPNLVAARAGFAGAAELGHSQAQCQLAYCLDEAIGGSADPGAATAWLFRAAGLGEARAAAEIALRYQQGHTLNPDPVSALAWYLCAQAAGHPGAAAAIQALRGQLERQQVDNAQVLARRKMPSVVADSSRMAERSPIVSTIICENPRILRLTNLLSTQECWHLMQIATPYLRPSRVLSSETGTIVSTAGRSSGGMSIIEPLADVVVRNIEQRLAGSAGLPVENGEPLALLRYESGDEYRPHYDFFDPQIAGQAKALAHGGQRLISILMYLCDVTEGGETCFPSAGISIRPQPGVGILFHNCAPDGTPDRASRHAGAPVRQGQKWLATKWMREGTFSPASLHTADHIAPIVAGAAENGIQNDSA